MAPVNIGEKLKQERRSRRLTLADISARTRIPVRFLKAIEANEFDSLPGLIFTRNFVRQYCEALSLDPDEMLAVLPKIEDAALPLPDPPISARIRGVDWANNSFISSFIWVCLAVVAGVAAYVHFNHAEGIADAPVQATSRRESAPVRAQAPAIQTQPVQTQAVATPAAVQVRISANAPSWISLTADGRNTYSGMLAPHEIKEISATEQVKLVAGNAGGLTVSLNGKPLDSLGSDGQVRVLRLTAEGPEFLSTAAKQPPAQAPL